MIGLWRKLSFGYEKNTNFRVGLNMRENNQFVAVSDGLLLDISNITPWAKGLNDPRLFYTVKINPHYES